MLKNKNILITGCNRGIGKAIMEKCAEYGANIFACMRQPNESFNELAVILQERYGAEIFPFYFDMESEESIKEASAKILKLKLPIDGLVNNAGIAGENLSFPMTSVKKIRGIFQVNTLGPLYLTQRILKNMMRNKNGSIIYMSSIAAIDGEPAQMGYVGSKSALIGATKKLASEMGRLGIRVNTVAPGITDTDMIKQMDRELLNFTLNRTALKRLARPEEIAEVVAFLLSDRSSYITGQIIRADGGVI